MKCADLLYKYDNSHLNYIVEIGEETFAQIEKWHYNKATIGILIYYSWPLNSAGVRVSDCCAVENWHITFDSPET